MKITPDAEQLSIFMRLIGMHSRLTPVEVNEIVTVHQLRFKVLAKYKALGNVAFIVFKEKREQFRNRMPQIVNERNNYKSHIIVCFNWFSPQGLLDLICLGGKILKSGSTLDNEVQMFNDVHYENALKMMKDDSFINSVINEIELYGPNALITLVGFSMGGCIASIIGYKLKKKYQDQLRFRCIGIGSPRPGNEKFIEWYKGATDENSYFVLLRENGVIDPVALDPPMFAPHPRCFILQDGNFFAIPPENLQAISNQTADENCEAWNKMHSILNYYEKLNPVKYEKTIY